MQTIHQLSRSDCARLLAADIAGRVAVVAKDGPHVIPVTYAVDGESVLVRTTPYSLLGTYGRDAVVCFEVDQVDHEYQRGWSVAVRGRAELVQDAAELDRIHRQVPLRPWADGPRNLLIRIPWTEVNGRRLGDGWDPLLHPHTTRTDP